MRQILSHHCDRSLRRSREPETMSETKPKEIPKLAVTKLVWHSHRSLMFLSGRLAEGWRRQQHPNIQLIPGGLCLCCSLCQECCSLKSHKSGWIPQLHSGTHSNVASSNKPSLTSSHFSPMTLFCFFFRAIITSWNTVYSFVNIHLLPTRMSDLWGKTGVSVVHLWFPAPRFVVSFSEMPPNIHWVNELIL